MAASVQIFDFKDSQIHSRSKIFVSDMTIHGGHVEGISGYNSETRDSRGVNAGNVREY